MNCVERQLEGTKEGNSKDKESIQETAKMGLKKTM